MKDEYNRVVFYSKHDLSANRNLENAESIISSFKFDERIKINEVIELYHIKLYFDNEIFHPSWSEKKQKDFIEIVKSFWEKIREFWSKIDNENIVANFDIIEYHYYDAFWKLINLFSTYERIEVKTFNTILNNKRL